MSLVKPVTTSLNRRRKIAIDTQFEMGVLPNKVVKNSLSFWKQKIKMHDNACGIGILDKNLAAFHEYANKELADMDFGESWYEVNFERIAADTDIEDLIVDIASHEDIWGQGCSEPLIHIKDINITKNDIRIMGKDSSTVRIEKFGIAYMKFHAKDFIEELGKYDGEIKLEVVGRANLNTWGGYTTPQIFISNYQIEDGTLGF